MDDITFKCPHSGQSLSVTKEVEAPRCEAKDGEDVLWHFTTPDTLVSILKNGFRATHSQCLSDRLEGILRNELQNAYLKSAIDRDAAWDPSHDWESILARHQRLALGDVSSPTFISCFSQNPDFDAMWEQYGPKGGYAIGVHRRFLDPKELEKGTKEWQIVLRECNYNHFDDMRTAIAEKVCDFKAKMESTTTEAAKDELQKSFRSYAMDQSFEMIFIKRKIFQFEREVRLVHRIFPAQFLDDKFLNFLSESLRLEDGKLYVFAKPTVPPATWIAEIRVSPYGEIERNLGRAMLIAQSFGIDSAKVKLDHLPTITD